MEAVHGSMLLVYAVIAIAVLILMITRFKVYPFLVLIIVSLLLGLAAGMPMSTIVKSFETGNGNTLGHIAVVVGLGTMLGKMMAESGGAERVATTLIDWFGEKAHSLGDDGRRDHRRLAGVFRGRLRAVDSDRVQRREAHRQVAAADRPADGRGDCRSCTG